MRIFLRRLKKTNKISFISFWIIVFLYLLAIFADFVSPYPYDLQHRDYPMAPPTKIHFFDKEGKFHLRPFVYKTELVNVAFNEYREDYSKIYPIKLFVKGKRRKILGNSQKNKPSSTKTNRKNGNRTHLTINTYFFGGLSHTSRCRNRLEEETFCLEA